MLTVKRCAQCVGNSFKILHDAGNIQLICEQCGQSYLNQNLKRLPDDIEATRSIKISIQPPLRVISHV